MWIHICSIDPCIYFVCVCAIPFHYCGSVVKYEIRDCDTSSTDILSKDWFSYQGLLWYCTNVRIICYNYVKRNTAILLGMALNLEISLGSIIIITVFILPINEHSISSHLFIFVFQFLSPASYSFLRTGFYILSYIYS